ncbi:MAG: UDP-N-acetylglucosamine 1-carboxyvinyltransferase [Candidatus Dormibacteraceae bacterium]
MDTVADGVLKVSGGAVLAGSLTVSGSKNASLPVMAAALLTRSRVRLHNVPQVADTALMAEILTALGAVVEVEGGLICLAAESVSGSVPAHLGRRMRASIVLLGAVLTRTGQARLPKPGGDQIGTRRVEQHIRGLRAMGASIEESDSEITARAPDGLHGARVIFDLPTVTGTENIMLAAALADGRTEIFNAAREPHVQDLARFLNAMGAQVRGAGTDQIVIEGVAEMHGCEHRVIPDYLEAGTYALAVAAAGGDLVLLDAPVRDLTQLLSKLEEAGVAVETESNRIRIQHRRTSPLSPVDMSTFVHPGFPTDLQAPYLALMTQAAGTCVISEYLFENRFQHVPELVRMGAAISVSGRDAHVRGPSPLVGCEVDAPDIRSGAALIIAALCARGETVIHRAWHVDRGYQDMAGKLAGLGAVITRGPETRPLPGLEGGFTYE